MKFCFAIAAISAMTMVGGATASCSLDNEIGDSSGLDVWSPSELNTAEIQEEVPDIPPLYSPLDDAVCFNEEYDPPKLSTESMVKLYKDFEEIFEWGFRNQMGSPLQSVSEDNNFVTNNRFPGMYLRMCFHDNTVDPDLPDFQDYIGQNFDKHGSWHGYSKYLETSGADASLLVCEKERLHPNNDYDKTASRVLYSMQVGGVIDGGKSLKQKWGLSYADLLHNGCLAAATYLTRQAPSSIFHLNPMQVGRQDACFVKSGCGTKFELCGPSNILPGLALSASQVNNWFTSRGMSECQWMSLMWTHTTLDNMASTCPLKLLPCLPGPQETYEFTEGGTDEPYFFPGDRLDYFSFFLKPGSHKTSNGFLDDPEDTSCDWKVDDKKKPWPMTAIDCTLGLDNVERSGETTLKNAILNFHKPAYNAADILMCALNTLGGRGDAEGGICDIIAPQECQSTDGHKFGGIFAGSIPTNVAKGKFCYQSSFWDTNVRCTRAIDGNTDGNYYTGSVMHTAYEVNPRLSIDLGDDYDISAVAVYDRVDAGAGHLAGFVVELRDWKDNAVWTSPPLNGDRKQYIHVPNLAAKSVVVIDYSSSKKYLHVAEVEVFGTKSSLDIRPKFITYGERIMFQNMFVENRWLTGGRGSGNHGVDTRDIYDDYERSISYHYTWLTEGGEDGSCIKYGDHISLQVISWPDRWLTGGRGSGNYGADTRKKSDSNQMIFRSSPGNGKRSDIDPMHGQCIADLSVVYLQVNNVDHRWLTGARGSGNKGVKTQSIDTLETFQWIVRREPGVGLL